MDYLPVVIVDFSHRSRNRTPWTIKDNDDFACRSLVIEVEWIGFWWCMVYYV
jgi:hypothetical protein